MFTVFGIPRKSIGLRQHKWHRRHAPSVDLNHYSDVTRGICPPCVRDTREAVSFGNLWMAVVLL